MMLTVCTECQKELLEMIASWGEKEDCGCHELEAALIYLFFTKGCLFDPPDFPCIVKLSRGQLLNLEESLINFLPSAERMGYELPIKDALARVRAELGRYETQKERLKSYFKPYLRFFGVACIFFPFFWIVFSLKIAIFFALSAPVILTFFERLFKFFREYINAQNSRKLSIILRRINYQEIKVLREWAENYLVDRGVINGQEKQDQPKKVKHDPEIESILKKIQDSIKECQFPPAVSEAYDKWSI